MNALQVTVMRPAARLGLKGPDAAALLLEAGIAAPTAPNRVVLAPRAGDATAARQGLVRVLRLGNTEYVLEQDVGNGAICAVHALARDTVRRAWPVVRADCSLLVTGDDVFDSLSRLCAFDFAQLAAQPDQAVMTLLADISVTFALEPSESPAPGLRLWVDPGFATYLIHALRSHSSDVPSHGVHA